MDSDKITELKVTYEVVAYLVIAVSSRQMLYWTLGQQLVFSTPDSLFFVDGRALSTLLKKIF